MNTKFQLGDYILGAKAQIRMIDKIEISIEAKGTRVKYYNGDGLFIGEDEILNKDYVRRMEMYLQQLKDVLNKMKTKLQIEE